MISHENFFTVPETILRCLLITTNFDQFKYYNSSRVPCNERGADFFVSFVIKYIVKLLTLVNYTFKIHEYPLTINYCENFLITFATISWNHYH